MTALSAPLPCECDKSPPRWQRCSKQWIRCNRGFNELIDRRAQMRKELRR